MVNPYESSQEAYDPIIRAELATPDTIWDWVWRWLEAALYVFAGWGFAMTVFYVTRWIIS